MDKIDFVVLWVDGSDKRWRAERKRYAKQLGENKEGNCESRFRDWSLFKYWFRGVEKYAPWVNNVFLVTEGHVPKWLNTNNPKLKIVKHSDFMRRDALPTYNSNAIELSLNNIEGLSEQFVLFNDDLFIINQTKSTDFFKNGKPVNTMSLSPIFPCKDMGFYKTVYNNIEVINSHFDFKIFRRKNIKHLLSLKQRKYLLWSITGSVNKFFTGFANFHMPNSILKSTLDELWRVEEKRVLGTVNSRFRNYDTNINQWILNYWQFASGNFEQRSSKFGISTRIDDTHAPAIIRNQKTKILCLNDYDDIKNAELVEKKLVECFEELFPEKSGYEK